eukprot:5165958-Amphidinium_carterae.1
MEAAKERQINKLKATAVAQASHKQQRIQELESTVSALQAERSKTEENTRELESQLRDLKSKNGSKDAPKKE